VALILEFIIVEWTLPETKELRKGFIFEGNNLFFGL
jgi:hypothetical protein